MCGSPFQPGDIQTVTASTVDPRSAGKDLAEAHAIPRTTTRRGRLREIDFGYFCGLPCSTRTECAGIAAEARSHQELGPIKQDDGPVQRRSNCPDHEQDGQRNAARVVSSPFLHRRNYEQRRRNQSHRKPGYYKRHRRTNMTSTKLIRFEGHGADHGLSPRFVVPRQCRDSVEGVSKAVPEKKIKANHAIGPSRYSFIVPASIDVAGAESGTQAIAGTTDDNEISDDGNADMALFGEIDKAQRTSMIF